MRKFCAIFGLLVILSTASHAQITVDGTLNESQYVTIATKQNSNNGFGAGFDISKILYYPDDAHSILYLGIIGKLPVDTNNALGIWLNFSGTGAPTGVSAGDSLGGVFDGGTTFPYFSAADGSYKADFQVDYQLCFNTGGTDTAVYFDAAKMIGTPTQNYMGSCNQIGTPSTNGAATGSVFAQNTITFAFNNSGQSNTGLELAIPYSQLGVSSSDFIQAFAFGVSFNHPAYFSNVTVPGNVTQGNPGYNPDFSTMANGPYHTGNGTTTWPLTISSTPAISSFTPASGPVGSSVTISGANFNPSAGNDAVYFGGMKAKVTSATSTSLVVTVPSGAMYQPISVTDTTSGLTTVSRQAFVTTFTTGGTIDTTTFSTTTGIPVGGTPYVYNIASGDLDGDGKPDLVVTNINSGTISVFRNTSSKGTVSFVLAATLSDAGSPRAVAVGDIDGDGKLDIVVTDNTGSSISVFRNTSTPGSFTFGTRQTFASGESPDCVALGDLDGDGRLDIVVSNWSSNTVSVLRNLSSKGNISFAQHIDFGTGAGPNSVAVGDLDSDGKPDLVVADYTADSVSIYRNTSTKGNISFASRFDVETGINPNCAAVGDLDGDGRLDLVVLNSAISEISVYPNTSSAGNISFATATDYMTGGYPNGLAIGDLNGDGKPDIAVTNYNSTVMSIFPNTSTRGNVTLDVRIDCTTGTGSNGIAIVDVDGDGPPDIVEENNSSGSWSVVVHRNTISNSSSTPFPPTLLSPANGATGVSTNPTLTWNPSSGATAYAIEIQTDSTFGSQTIIGMTVTSYTDSGLSTGTKYYWRARAANSTGISSWSATWSFTTTNQVSPSTAPVLVSPANGATNLSTHPALTWDPSAGATSYRVQVGIDPSYSTVIIDKSGIVATSLDLSGLDVSSEFYWRVSAANAAGASSWSPTYTFVTFSYPASVTVSEQYTPPSSMDTSNYQIIGVPGDVDIPLANVLSGSLGTDWKAYYDNGSDQNYYVEYDGTTAFDFQPGRAFWVISRNPFSFSKSYPSVTLDDSDCYSIGLHNGWNLISNPFEKSVPWSSVQSANGGSLQPINAFNGTYSQPASFDPYRGYYFDNVNDLSSIKIPYLSGSAGESKPGYPPNRPSSIQGSTIELSLSSGECQPPPVEIGFNPALDTLPSPDIYAPPDNFDDVRIQVIDQNVKGSWKKLYSDFRSKIGSGQSFLIQVKNLTSRPALLKSVLAPGLENYKVFLADMATLAFYDLRTTSSISIDADSKSRDYMLLIGDREYVDSVHASFEPKNYTLAQNYPNPFNPTTAIDYRLPKSGHVTLMVYDILGRQVATLVDREENAGAYQVYFDGSRLASGVYFYRLQAGKFTSIRKLMLVK